jgi:protein-disulfide isomerase
MVPVNRNLIAAAAAVVVLAGLATASYVSRRNVPPPPSALSAPTARSADSAGQQNGDDLLIAARTRGDTKAPLVMYEVSDFQCPYCRQFWAETLPRLEAEYIRTGKLRLTFINFPISQLHPNAQAAHELAMCGAEQGKFWRLHDLLYDHQAQWAGLRDPKPYFLTLADSARLSRSDLERCYAAGRVRQLIAAETQTSWQAGVQSTPSFIVQGVLLAGTAPIENFRPILDSMYAARGTVRDGEGR